MNAANPKPYKLPEDAVWLITGCSSGIGRALATLIASQPSQRLIATARDPSSLSYLPSTESNPRILKLPLDVTSPTSVEAAFKAARAHFSNSRDGERGGAADTTADDAQDNFHIDVLVNNAGYALSGDTEAATEEEMHEEIETNFFGTVRVTQQALKWMRPQQGEVGEKEKKEEEEEKEHRGGLIVNMSSLAGVCAFPGHSFYHASKFAVEGWTESVAKEMHPDWNINFTLIQPSAVHTFFETHSKKTIAPHPAYVDPSFPARKLEKLVEQGLKAGYGVLDPADVAQKIWDLAGGGGDGKGEGGGKGGGKGDGGRVDGRVPLRLPVGEIAYGLIGTILRGRMAELEKLREGKEKANGKEEKKEEGGVK